MQTMPALRVKTVRSRLSVSRPPGVPTLEPLRAAALREHKQIKPAATFRYSRYQLASNIVVRAMRSLGRQKKQKGLARFN